MTATSTPPDRVYQIKVTLRDSKPPIWRRLLVPADTTLYDLHRIIQVATGWTNSHLHQFIVGQTYYGIPSGDDWLPVEDERDYRLADVLPEKKAGMIYEYDFGDGWEHGVRVEEILSGEAGEVYPRCLGGKTCLPAGRRRRHLGICSVPASDERPGARGTRIVSGVVG